MCHISECGTRPACGGPATPCVCPWSGIFVTGTKQHPHTLWGLQLTTTQRATATPCNQLFMAGIQFVHPAQSYIACAARVFRRGTHIATHGGGVRAGGTAPPRPNRPVSVWRRRAVESCEARVGIACATCFLRPPHTWLHCCPAYAMGRAVFRCDGRTVPRRWPPHRWLAAVECWLPDCQHGAAAVRGGTGVACAA